MSFGRTLTLGFGVFVGVISAQDCPAVASVIPNASLSGSLSSASCQLSDNTPYVSYRLDLPVRGQITLGLVPTSASRNTADGNSNSFSLILRDSTGIKVASGGSLARPIEAGNYTLLVNGATPGQSGDFTVATTFVPEPGVLCSNFPNIGRRQIVDGRLPSSGCLALDRTAYEAYTLTTDGTGTLTVTVTSQDFTPMIAVRSIDGRPLTMPSVSPVNVVLPGDSQYLLILSSSDKSTGAYQITNSFQTAGNENCRSLKTLQASDSDTNSISATSCFVTIAGSGDQSYYNYYNFMLTEPGVVSATVVSGDFTSTLNLLDAAGNILTSDSGGGGLDAQYSVRSALRAQLPPGLYRMQVFSDLPSGGNYQLNYSFQAGSPHPCSASVLNAGDHPTGALSETNCRTSIGNSDLYTLTLPSAGTVDVEINSGEFDTILAIRDSKDNLIVRDDEVGGLNIAHISADLPAGVYTVVGAANSGAGHYQLTAKFTAHEIPACTYVQSLDLNGGFIQRLGPRSCIGMNGQPVDYYGFTLAVDSLVLAVMTSSELDGYLTMLDAKGNVVRSDDSSYGSNDPLIVQYLPAGTYRLAARDASSTVGGLYEVDLRTVSGARPALCTPKSNVKAGDTVSGMITFTGCQTTDNTFGDLYQMDLPADSTVDLRLNSSDFDAYLTLMDSKGAVVDEDDDSGGNTNSRITHALAAGTYFLLVAPLGDYTAHGAYSLVTKVQ